MSGGMEATAKMFKDKFGPTPLCPNCKKPISDSEVALQQPNGPVPFCFICREKILAQIAKSDPTVFVPKPESDLNPRPWIPTALHYISKNDTDIRDIIEDFELNFNRGCVAKYIFRAGRKPGNSELMEMYKAREHLNREIARLEKSISKEQS